MAEAREVSTRIARMLLEYAEWRADLDGRLGPLQAVLATGEPWMSWASYLEVLRSMAGGDAPELHEAFGASVMDFSAQSPFRHVGTLTGGTHALFQATYGWVLGTHINVIRSTVEELGPGQIRVALELDRDQPDGTIFFYSTAGTIRRLPVLLGQGEARVAFEIESHRAVYSVELAPSQALGPRLRRAWRTLWDVEGMDLAMSRLRASVVDTIDSLAESNEELRRSEERWRALTGAMPGVIALMDGQGRIEALLGARVPEVGAAIGTPLVNLAPESERSYLTSLAERVLDGETVEDTARVVVGGRVSHWAFRAAPMPGERRAVVVGVDVTEGVRAREDLRESEQRLAQAQKMEVVARLAGGLAHDVNNVLAAVQGHAEILELARPEDAAVQRAADGILQAVERASRLTRQLLAYGTEMPVEPRSVDLGAMVEEARGLLARVVGEDVDFVLELPDEPVWARADPAQLEQVLLNLVLNARDAVAGGGRVVVRVVADPNRALLEVEDDGPGMGEEVLRRAREPFFSTKDAARGSGLGLFTVHAILERSHGGLELDTVAGQGTTARAWLPRSFRAQATPAPPPRTRPAARSGHVLLVEDDDDVRELLAEMVVALGYRVTACANGHAALDAIAKDPSVGVLVTDMVMPGPSGLEVARTAVARVPDLPVLLISGFTDQDPAEVRDFAARSGFLRKPFGLEALAAALEQLEVAPV